jgi:pyruvate-formate lyase
VPAEPARTFHEAVQALWFAHILTVWEDGINANGIGRIDQMLWPYLERDLANGATTWEEAAELLGALWCKLYRPYDVQQMMIGGLHSDGSDATNPLSYLVLDVTEGMDFIRCLSARLHAGSPRDFVSRCVDLVAKGGGIPFFFNDEALVPALVSRGVPLEDARGYAAIGCIEITIPGKAYPHAVSNWINVAKCLELALNDGKDLLDGTQLGPRTGTLAEFAGMDDVLAAYTKQLETFAELVVYGSNACETGHRSQFRLPYLSLLTDDCVGRGLDIIEGGARYNYHCSAAMGIPNAADSLAGLQSAVFGDRSVTPAEMLKALRSNYEGEEVLRLQLRNRVPKYGNDEALPDGFAADLTRQYCDLMARYRTVGGGTFFCHLFTFTLMLPYGKLTGASPDGRRAGEPLAYSVSPAQGRDKEGLTAVMNSLARLPHHLVAASSSAIVEVDPGLLEGSSREAFVDLLVTAVKQGVGQLQFNVVSAETLRAAQDDPERYGNLCVRVSGFSQQFRLLDREMQEHIIARTKHKR